MVNALFDTNILIDHLNGIEEAMIEMRRYESRAISVITWMEVLVGATADEEQTLRAWLNSFRVIAVDDAVSSRAVQIRKAARIKQPDAIIWACAQAHSMLLVTRNTKDFSTNEPGVRIPYQLT
ncbi:type II toxin-antitoxin system VapC family toxin [Cupriavidus sp. CuC1]|uniref:type II toxin-antitoxin system VapC family toxin n=1 Tax=Cupriavidus sp. CuC1 TaxID=3373131 RepID=UPI0037D6C3FC